MYTGSKNGSGVYQAIINNIPPHKRYFELFAGSASVFFNKIPANYNYLAELDTTQCLELQSIITTIPGIKAIIKNVNALAVIDIFDFTSDDFIYLDPPYPFECRKTKKDLYKYELTDSDHVKLLTSLLDHKSMIMISTRENSIYTDMLSSWRRIEISTSDRGGAVTELLYVNYPTPVSLHQYNFLGDNNLDRQRIKRKIERQLSKLERLPIKERYAMLAAVQKYITTQDQQTNVIKASGEGYQATQRCDLEQYPVGGTVSIIK